MARYEFDCVDGWSVVDTVNKKFLDKRQILDLLNAHDGMIARTKHYLGVCEHNLQTAPFKYHNSLFAAKSAYETVLNGGTE